MKFHDLKAAVHKPQKRVGRGISAGQGKTAGRGTKGQKSRTGSKRRPGFEGGQNPLMQRLPKLRGFHSHRLKPENVYTGALDSFTGTVDNVAVAEAGLVSSSHVKVKLIVKGQLNKRLTITLQSASAGAIEMVQKAGGRFSAVPQVGRPSKSKPTKA